MMNVVKLSALLGLIAACLVSCQSESESTYYEHVQPILAGKCNGCHQEGAIGPYEFTTYDTAFELREIIKSSVEHRRMPPWLADSGCNDYVGDWTLSDEEIAHISSWATQGGLPGDPSNVGSPVSLADDIPSLSRVDLTVQAPAPFTPTKFPDEYRCFLIDWPMETTAYVTGIDTRPGNPSIVHHAISYLIQPTNVATYEALDAADPLPGYECFGGPGSTTASLSWLGAWAPGTPGSDTPEGTGIRVEPGSKIVLQVHYNVLNGDPIADQTAMDFRIDTSVEREAVTIPFVKIGWVFSEEMPIPAGEESVEHTFNTDLTQVIGVFSANRIASGQPLDIFSAGLHMHTRGKSASLRVEKAGGGDTCLLQIADWDFNWQRSYRFVEPVRFEIGDKLHLSCKFDNSAANQADGSAPVDLNWGDNTGDEMCLGILYVAPTQ